MVSNAEYFLVNATAKKGRLKLLTSFNMKSTIQKIFVLTLKSYHQLQKAFLKIQRDCYQCCMLVNSASNASVFLDPLCYDYFLDDNGKLVYDITSYLSIFYCHALVRNVQGILYVHEE